MAASSFFVDGFFQDDFIEVSQGDLKEQDVNDENFNVEDMEVSQFTLGDTTEFWVTLEMAAHVTHSPLAVAYSPYLEDFKKLISDVNNSVTLFHRRPQDQINKAYKALHALLQNCVEKIEEMRHAFNETDVQGQEICNGAQSLVFAFGGHCLNGSAYIVLTQKKVLAAQLEQFQELKTLFFNFADNSVFNFLERVGNIVADRSGVITLHFLLQFVTEAIEIVRKLETCSDALHKAFYRTTQAMDYAVKKFRDGNGAHLDTSDSDTEQEDALDIPIVRKKPRV